MRIANTNQAGDDRLNAELMRQYEGALRRFFGRRVRDATEVEDLVQEAFARLYESGDQRDLQRPVAYLFRIASNLIADRGRRLMRQPVQAELDSITERVGVAPDQEQGRMLADLQQALESALAQLSPRCREIFIMRRFHNRSTAEIATMLGITHRMVQKYMTRAMTHIYLSLEGAFGGAAIRD